MEDPRFCRVYLFRHGQTDWNAQGRIQGHLDVSLNETGRLQASSLIPHVCRLEIEAILSSDLSRALETARIAASQANAPVFSDPGLREIHFGILQGLSREEIRERLGEDLSHRLRHEPLSDADMEALGSETGEQVRARATETILRFVRERSYRRIGVASHGGVIRRLILAATGEFPSPVPNSCFYPMIVDRDSGEMRLERFMLFR